MNSLYVCLILLLVLVKYNNSFQLNRISSINNINRINLNQQSSLVNKSRSTTSLKDQNAFVIPLGISLFTIVPFVIYQQALKPKPRTVKQIELDEQLRPKDKKLNTGKAGQATAQGQKKK